MPDDSLASRVTGMPSEPSAQSPRQPDTSSDAAVLPMKIAAELELTTSVRFSKLYVSSPVSDTIGARTDGGLRVAAVGPDDGPSPRRMPMRCCRNRLLQRYVAPPTVVLQLYVCSISAQTLLLY